MEKFYHWFKIIKNVIAISRSIWANYLYLCAFSYILKLAEKQTIRSAIIAYVAEFSIMHESVYFGK